MTLLEAARKAVEASLVETRWYGGNVTVEWLEPLKFDGPSWYRQVCPCESRKELFSFTGSEMIQLLEFRTERLTFLGTDPVWIMLGQCSKCKILYIRERIR